MTETEALIDSYRRARAQNLRSALATVVRVEGSAYRQPGARMFITESGQTTGVLSGGCLERDVSERAAKVMRRGEAVIVKYDTTSDDDIVWGLGLGCNGVVHVLIEPADDARIDDLMRFLAECSRSQRRGALATVIHREGETEAEIGARTLLYPNEATRSELFIDEGVVSPEILDDLRVAVQNGASMIKRYDVDAASVEVFIEVIEPQVSLVIFGAGDDALPVVTFARNLGWHTTVVDTQARAITLERFAESDAVLLCRPEDVGDCVPLTENTAVVMMTHNYLHDLELMKTLLNSSVRYIGCLGPKRRTERLLLELTDGTVASADEYIGQLHAPTGLDIGAETPREIALSIISEITAVMTGREGGSLRNRKGTIHNRESEHRIKRTLPVSVGAVAQIACQNSL